LEINPPTILESDLSSGRITPQVSTGTFAPSPSQSSFADARARARRGIRLDRLFGLPYRRRVTERALVRRGASFKNIFIFHQGSNMRQHRIAVGTILYLSPLTLAGCSLVESGNDHRAIAEESHYAIGRGSREFNTSPAAVRQAVVEAMTDLDMKVGRRSVDGVVSQQNGTTANNQGVNVVIRPLRNQTRVVCRIGYFGDEPLSIALLDRVSIRLGEMPPAPIPAKIPSKPGSNPIFSRDAVSDEEMLRDTADAPYRDRVVP
jgi:Protein of unknown function (DUF3568)